MGEFKTEVDRVCVYLERQICIGIKWQRFLYILQLNILCFEINISFAKHAKGYRFSNLYISKSL